MAVVTSKDDIVFSSQGRAGTPDGNVFIDHTDPDNPLVEILSVAEVAQVDLGAGLVANPISATDGVSMRAIYPASVENRKSNDTERAFLRPARGQYAPAGAYDMVNNHQFATSTDLKLIRSSGVRYLSGAGNADINRVYFNPKSLNVIGATARPFYQTVVDGPATDASFDGPLDELVQVFGTTANGDTGAGNFDVRDTFITSIRSWGQTHDRKSLADSGIDSAENFTGGFGLGELPHPTTGNYTEADVLGGSAIAPWSTMSYKTEASPVSRSGFNEADGDFAESIENPAGGSLDQVVAFMDALARSGADIDDGTPTQVGRQVDTLYTFDAQGKVILKQGLYLEGIPGADRINVQHTDDLGNVKTSPVVNSITVNISTVAQGDADAWYEAFIENDSDTDDYNTANAITAQDKDGVEIKGTVAAASSISFDVNYSAAPPGTDIAANTPYVIRFIVGPGDPIALGDPVENFALITVDGTSKTIDLSNEPEQNI